ncbi:MAG: flippase-like domain-containing protein [Deltaproteobacteria bacterium]|nr:flippase-like domain-containing protein [Deltaproteobacteria bacterium]
MRKKRIWPLITIVSIAALIIIYIYHHPYSLEPFKDVSPSILICLIISRILFQITNGLILREVASKFNIVLTIKEWFGLPFVTAMGNYITPFSGGMIARASYLKYRHNFSYAQFVSVLGASFLIFFWIAGMTGIITLILSLERSAIYWQLIFFFGAVVLSISMVAILPSVKLPGNNRLSTLINNSLEGWDFIKSDLFLLTKLALYTLANIFINGISFWLAFVALYGTSLSVGKAFLISLFSTFSILVRITPGNLGVFESIVSLSSGILGVGVSPGLMVSLLIRAASMIPIFTLGPIFSFVLTRELAGNKRRNDDDN